MFVLYLISKVQFYLFPDVVNFDPGTTVQVSGPSGDSTQLSWPFLYHKFHSELLEHYGYLVRYKVKGERRWIETDSISAAGGTEEHTASYVLVGLRYNTTYQVQVIPYRWNGKVRESGNPTQTADLKTACIGIYGVINDSWFVNIY